MAKRKKVSKLVKAKAKVDSRYWRNKADAAWSKEVRKDGHCFVCGGTEYLQGHYLITRWFLPLRHDVRNGITLCPCCHKWDRKISGHQSPFGLAWLLQQKRPDQWKWLMSVFDRWDEIAARKIDYKAAYERITDET